MRKALVLAALAAPLSLAWAAPARADVTARYVTPTGVGAMVVEVNDKGDTRVSQGNKQAVLTLGGVSYVIDSDLTGTFAVRQDDWVAVQFEGFDKMIGENKPGPKDDVPFELVSKGSETVAGRTGTVWALRASGKTEGEMFDAVVSADPELAPIGRAIAGEFTLSTRMMRQMLGTVPDFMTKLDGIFAKGAVVRISKMFRLESVSRGPIPASEFTLPPVVLTKEQFAARLKPTR